MPDAALAADCLGSVRLSKKGGVLRMQAVRLTDADSAGTHIGDMRHDVMHDSRASKTFHDRRNS